MWSSVRLRSPHRCADMARRDFDRWVRRAGGYIYYPPDREAVTQELYWHYDDAIECFMEEGLDKEAAQAAALEALGSPDEVGRLLRRVHKHWLGWLSVVCAIGLAAAILFGFISLIASGFHTLRSELQHFTAEPYRFESSIGHEDVSLLARVRPSGEVECGDYTFQISDGWVMELGSERMLYLVVSYRSPRFWLGPPLGLGEFTHALESDGSTHLPYEYNHRLQDLECWRTSSSRSALGEYVFSMNVDDVPEWVELRFDNGRKFSLRAYTVEGGSP